MVHGIQACDRLHPANGSSSEAEGRSSWPICRWRQHWPTAGAKWRPRLPCTGKEAANSRDQPDTVAMHVNIYL